MRGVFSAEPCRDQVGDGGIATVTGTDMSGTGAADLFKLAMDLTLGVREGALGRAQAASKARSRSSALNFERLRDEEPADDMGDTGRSIPLRCLCLATLTAIDVRGSQASL